MRGPSKSKYIIFALVFVCATVALATFAFLQTALKPTVAAMLPAGALRQARFVYERRERVLGDRDDTVVYTLDSSSVLLNKVRSGTTLVGCKSKDLESMCSTSLRPVQTYPSTVVKLSGMDHIAPDIKSKVRLVLSDPETLCTSRFKSASQSSVVAYTEWSTWCVSYSQKILYGRIVKL